MDKPRVKFCWRCGFKLQGDHHEEKPVPKWSGDDIPRILHKSCHKEYKKEIGFQYDYYPIEKEYVEPEDEFESYGEVFV